jgi:hypothetical protein
VATVSSTISEESGAETTWVVAQARTDRSDQEGCWHTCGSRSSVGQAAADMKNTVEPVGFGELFRLPTDRRCPFRESEGREPWKHEHVAYQRLARGREREL